MLPLKIDKSYVVGGTGYLQGEPQLQKMPKLGTLLHLKCMIFTWAADPDFIHDTYPGPDGVTLNFYYQNNPKHY